MGVNLGVPRPVGRPLLLLRVAIVVGCTGALAALSWLPAKAVTRTMLGGHAEHLIAYMCSAIVIGWAFPKSSRLAVQAILLIAYAAILEAGQLYAPGRHASVQDFAFSAAGVVLGLLLLWSIARRKRA